MTRKVIQATIIFLISTAIPAWAAHDIHKVNSHLQQLKQQISKVSASISSAQQQSQTLQHELKATELKSAHIELNLKKNREQLHHVDDRLQKLLQQHRHYQNTCDMIKQQLATKLRAIYILGETPYLQLILNQQDPNRLSRMLTYYQYFSTAEMNLLIQYQKNLHATLKTQQQINQQHTQLQQLVHTQLSEKSAIKKSESQRKYILHLLNHKILNKKQQLAQLIDNQHHLEKIIQALQHAQSFQGGNFAHNAHHLKWPIHGKILNQFGSPIYHSQLHYDYVLIKTSIDQPVHAIANGRVIFAKWMEGYGLLLIIDHGNGYMSLYGHNNLLLKHQGDIIHAGDVVAETGQSGGLAAPELYFALRHNGKPLNPNKWCE